MGKTPVDLAVVDEVLDGDDLLTTAESAALLGIKPETLRKNRPDIPFIQVGQPRYRRSVIMAERAREQAARARQQDGE